MRQFVSTMCINDSWSQTAWELILLAFEAWLGDIYFSWHLRTCCIIISAFLVRCRVVLPHTYITYRNRIKCSSKAYCLHTESWSQPHCEDRDKLLGLSLSAMPLQITSSIWPCPIKIQGWIKQPIGQFYGLHLLAKAWRCWGERANALCSALRYQLIRLTPLGKQKSCSLSPGLLVDCTASLILRRVTTSAHISVRMCVALEHLGKPYLNIPVDNLKR